MAVSLIFSSPEAYERAGDSAGPGDTVSHRRKVPVEIHPSAAFKRASDTPALTPALNTPFTPNPSSSSVLQGIDLL